MKTFVTIAGAALLALSGATTSDARQHSRRPGPTQNEPAYYSSDYNTAHGRDSSCFYSTGLPELYACSANGG